MKYSKVVNLLILPCVVFSTLPSFAKDISNKVQPVTDTKLRICGEPKSPIYKKNSDFEKIDVSLMTDYNQLNQHSSASQVNGVIRVYRTDKQKYEVQPVVLTQRGNSRREYCSSPPFRVQFLNPEIKNKIEAQLGREKLDISSAEYLKIYLEKLNATSFDSATAITSLKDGVFKGLGDDIKVVTHCGESNWEMVGGADQKNQNKRLLSEFTIYKVLDTLKTTIEQTRLMNITYYQADGSPAFKDVDGKALVKLAFFREPPKSVAERCGLVSKLDPKAVYPKKDVVDTDSEFQTRFINRFVFNNDFEMYGHNMNIFHDIEGKIVYGAYDFDLSGIILDNYFKNAKNIEEQLPNVMSHLNSGSKETAINIAQKVIDQEPAMRKVVAESEIDDEMKIRFFKWLDLYMPALRDFVKQ